MSHVFDIYATFDLANIISFNKVNIPNINIGLSGMVI